MTDITEQTVIEVHILFTDYLTERMPIVSVWKYDGKVEESNSSDGMGMYALVEDVVQKEVEVGKYFWEDITRFFVFKRKSQVLRKVKEFKEEKILGPIFLWISQDTRKIAERSPHTVIIDITVFEGDEKEKYEDLYNQIVDHARTYKGLYNHYAPNGSDWIKINVTRTISLKMKSNE